MKVIRPQEVWFAEFPYREDNNQFKDRPVIVLEVDDEEARVLSMKVTSTPPRSEYEIEIFDWALIPLKHISTADATSVRRIPKRMFRRKLGKLSDEDWDNVMTLYFQYLEATGNNI